MAETWRDWRLVWYSTAHYKRRPSEKPPKTAELSGDHAWASTYADDGRTVTAMWMRYRLPTRETLAREAQARREREAARSSTTTAGSARL